MPTFKTRRLLRPTGGITVGGFTVGTGGGVTAGSLNVSSGCTVIGASGIAIGAGTKILKVLVGSAAACVPQINSSTMGAGSIAIAGLTAGAKVFFSGASVANASCVDGYFVQSLGTTGAAGASVYFANTTGVNGGAASVMGFHYIGFNV